MKALIVDNAENPQFRLADIPTPTPLDNQVLVRIKASGVNPVDYKIRTGKAPYTNPQYPAILGTDLAGIIEKVGSKVKNFNVGDEVYGLTGGVAGIPGSLAQYAAVDASLLAKKPINLTMKEAAGVPLVFLTAWEGIVDKAAVHAGQKVLVIGGSGGVGHMVVQIALDRGGIVFATASPAKHSIIQQYGVTPIDRNTPIQEIVNTYTNGKGFDIIYDTVGGTLLGDAFKGIKNNGHVVSCAAKGSQDLTPLFLHAGSFTGVFVLLPLLTGTGRAHHGAVLQHATQMIEGGYLRPLIDPRHFTLETASEAQEEVVNGTALGKIVIDIEDF